MSYVSGIYQGTTTFSQSSEVSERNDTLGKDEFLTLLVAQLQNQDPLNPTDSTEWTAQLAQYSQLEQSMNLNDTMEELLEAQKNSDRLAALSLIGKEAMVEGTDFYLPPAGEVEIGYTVDGQASNITLSVLNSGGAVVKTMQADDLSQGNHFIIWDGLDNNGQELPAGNYQIMIQAQAATQEETVGVYPLVRTEITGVDLGNNEATLITSAGEFTLSSVHGIYEPQQ
ncbi:flagellar hook assembly protein FlgD [Desulfolithobacter sp.]